MIEALESLTNDPDLGSAVVASAIVLSHACAGAGGMLMLVSPQAPTRAWQRADRLLLVFALAVALPSIAFALLVTASASRDTVLAARDAFGPLLAASIAAPVGFLGLWSARSIGRPGRASRVAGWLAVAAGACGVLLGAAFATWCWSPSAWIEARSLRSALSSPWLLALLALRSAAAAAIGGTCVWALAAPRLDGSAARRTLAVSAGATAFTALCLCALCVTLSSGSFHDPWLGVPALSGPHGGRARRLMFVALAASANAAAIALWAARCCRQQRFAPAGAAALSLIALFCFEQARAASVLPWGVPGIVYANGTSAERARLQRRSPRLQAAPGASREAVGNAVFSLQCSACHALDDSRAQAAGRGFPETRALLERLREADQPGNPWRGVMPPLVGSDDEVDALSRWISGRP